MGYSPVGGIFFFNHSQLKGTVSYFSVKVSVCVLQDPNLQICELYNACIEVISFFKWDSLNGLNISFMWMLGSGLLFVGILVLIETGIIKRILAGRSKMVRFLKDSIVY